MLLGPQFRECRRLATDVNLDFTSQLGLTSLPHCVLRKGTNIAMHLGSSFFGGYSMSTVKENGMDLPIAIRSSRLATKRRVMLLVGLCVVSLSGCANMTPTQQSALSGGAIGAAGGAVLGTVVGGSPAIGAAVGGAVGAAGGALLSQNGQ